MKPEFILLIIIGGFLSALLVFLIILYKPVFPSSLNQLTNKNTSEAASSDTDTINSLKSKIKSLEEDMGIISQQQKDQIATYQDLKTDASTQSAQIEALRSNKSILASASTRGSLFTTTSATYTPMGMYVNIKCPNNCLLWINFYTSSKNVGSPGTTQGNVNTYDVFLNNSDQSVYSQASFPVDSSYIPVSLNVAISVAAGVHTVDIRAKTTGGKLQSDSSALQVMAIER